MRSLVATLFLLLTSLGALPALRAQVGCAGSTPVATFKLFAKPEGFAPYPLRELNQLQPGMKIQYQPVTIPGDDPDDARIAMILAESRHGVSTQRLEIVEPQRADRVAEWTVPFRTELVALVYGPQGFSESKVDDLLRKDVSLIRQLADYAEQNQRVEDLINVLAQAESAQKPAESLDAALAGVAARYGTPMTQLNRQAPTSEQAMALMGTLNPVLTNYDPLAPDSSQRLQQSAGLAASVAGLFWGSQVGLYAGGAGLFLNLRSLMFPGSEFRSALIQTGAEQQMSLCSKSTQHKSRTRLAYLWAARIPDTEAPGLTLRERPHLATGLPASVPVTLSDAALWKFVDRARDWKLVAADGAREYSVAVVPDVPASSLRFTPPAGAVEGDYKLAARWDWEILRTNGYLHLHRIPSGPDIRISESTRKNLVEDAKNVELALEGVNFRFVEQATLVRRNDPYASPRSVPFRLVEIPGTDSKSLFVLLNGEPLRRGEYRLTLKQQGGTELSVDVPVLPEAPVLTGLPITLNLGDVPQQITLQGKHLDLIKSLDANGISWERVESATGQPVFRAVVAAGVAEGSKQTLRLTLTDRPEPVVLADAVEIRGPLPEITSKRIAYRQENGVALREGEFAFGALVTALLDVRHGSSRQTLHLGCANASMQTEALELKAGESHRDARLQASNAENLYLTFDPGKIGQSGCEVEARVRTPNGESTSVSLGRVVRLPKLESFSLSDELVGEHQFSGTLIGEDLEAVAQVGWDKESGVPVMSIPRPREGDSRKQELRIALPWPAPSPRAPLYVWLRNESEGRETKARLGS